MTKAVGKKDGVAPETKWFKAAPDPSILEPKRPGPKAEREKPFVIEYRYRKSVLWSRIFGREKRPGESNRWTAWAVKSKFRTRQQAESMLLSLEKKDAGWAKYLGRPSRYQYRLAECRSDLGPSRREMP